MSGESACSPEALSGHMADIGCSNRMRTKAEPDDIHWGLIKSYGRSAGPFKLCIV